MKLNLTKRDALKEDRGLLIAEVLVALTVGILRELAPIGMGITGLVYSIGQGEPIFITVSALLIFTGLAYDILD